MTENLAGIHELSEETRFKARTRASDTLRSTNAARTHFFSTATSNVRTPLDEGGEQCESDNRGTRNRVGRHEPRTGHSIISSS